MADGVEGRWDEPEVKRVRRNGIASSCEPCRKSKLACDHELPCSRCIRGKKDCYYHPSPMSRANTTVVPDPAHLPDGPNEPNEPNEPNSPQSFDYSFRKLSHDGHKGRPNHDGDTKASPLSTPFNLEPGAPIRYNRGPSRYVPGFLGSTGHSATLLNNKGLVGEDDLSGDPIMSAPEWCETCNENQNLVRFGTTILAWLPNRDVCEEAMARYFRVTLAVTSCKPMYDLYVQRFWDTYGPLLLEPRCSSNMACVSKSLCKNTAFKSSNDLSIPKSTPEFLDSFTGPRSRWDMLGSVMIAIGFVALSLPPTDPFLHALLPKNMLVKDFATSLLEVGDACLMLCDELDVQNNLLSLLLLYKCTCYQAVIGGDVSSSLWKRMGSLIAATTAFGLHKRSPKERPYSLLFVELQKRIFSSVLGMSYELATFHGRPPGITRHYLSNDYPLDASEAELMQDDEGAIKRNLCSSGWNRAGKIHAATMGKAFMVSHLLREEILEICLGRKLPPQELQSRIQGVRDRIDKEFADFPDQLKTPLSKELLHSKDAWDIACIAQVQLRFIHHSFLLEQLDHPGRDEERHLQTARRLLEAVNLLWTERDRFVEHKDDVHWFLTNYGIPSASTLSVDLYHQVSGNPPKPTSPHRSKTIQDLSLFVAGLEWVSKLDGNYALCQRVSKLLRHILDRVLAPPAVNGYYSPQDQFAGFGLNEMSVASVPAFGAELEDWLNVDWSNAPRMMFG